LVSKSAEDLRRAKIHELKLISVQLQGRGSDAAYGVFPVQDQVSLSLSRSLSRSLFLCVCLSLSLPLALSRTLLMRYFCDNFLPKKSCV